MICSSYGVCLTVVDFFKGIASSLLLCYLYLIDVYKSDYTCVLLLLYVVVMMMMMMIRVHNTKKNIREVRINFHLNMLLYYLWLQCANIRYCT